MDNLPEQTQKPQPPKEGQFPTSPPTSQPPVIQTVQAQQPGGKKRTITKIFTALAIFLVLVLLSELAYFFFNKNTGVLKRTPEAPDPETQEGAEVVSVQEEVNQPTPLPELSDNAQKALDFIHSLKEDGSTAYLEEAQITWRVRGEFVAGREQRVVVGNVPYVYELVIRNPGTEDFIFKLSEETVQGLSVNLNTPDGPRPSSLSDINPGDSLTITYIADLVDTTSSPNVLLTVDPQ